MDIWNGVLVGKFYETTVNGEAEAMPILRVLTVGEFMRNYVPGRLHQ